MKLDAMLIGWAVTSTMMHTAHTVTMLKSVVLFLDLQGPFY